MGDQFIDAVRNLATPHNANYHRKFRARFSEIAEPLYVVTGKASVRWREEQQQFFEALVKRLTSPLFRVARVGLFSILTRQISPLAGS